MRHRILVVDDHPDAAETTCRLLGLFGHDCRAARSGAQALAVAHEFQPTIALLDIGLPDLSGLEVARRLRRELALTPYLAAFTGWGEAHDRLASLAAGFDEHLVKPASGAQLGEMIRRASATGGGPGPAASARE